MALVEDLLARVRAGGPNPAWVRAHVGAPQHPVGPSDAWVARWSARLRPGAAVGRALAQSPGAVASFAGPAYQRVLLGTAPTFSAVVVASDDGPRIQELTWTGCTLCSEPERFVVDLIEDLQHPQGPAQRLVPGVELDLAGAPEGSDGEWIGTLSLRNNKGRYLQRLLAGATVAGVDGDIVRVRYADGTVDPWTILWKNGRWMLDYGSLEPSSAARLQPRDEPRWRRHRTLRDSARASWNPSFRPMATGAGISVGWGVLDAWPDPNDGTILALVVGVDQVLAGVFRIDPEAQTVIERLPIPVADERTPVPLGRWFTRWPAALSPTGRHLAWAGPNRVWSLDLQTGRSREVTRGDTRWLGWGRRSGRPEHLWVARGADLWGHTPGAAATRDRLDDRPIAVTGGPSGPRALTAAGDLVDLDSGEVVDRLCCDRVRDAQDQPGTGMIATCAEPCDTASVLVGPTTTVAVPGAASHGPGAAWSADGVWFLTGQDHPEGDLLLWRARASSPVARVPVQAVHRARFATDSAHLLTVSDGGQVHWWSLESLVAQHGLQARVTAPR